jgi:hypothetical protein
MSLKNPVTPPGIDPGTVLLVAQRPNHYATPGIRPTSYKKSIKIIAEFILLAKRKALKSLQNSSY